MTPFDIKSWIQDQFDSHIDTTLLEGLSIFYKSFIKAGTDNGHQQDTLHNLFTIFAKMVIQESFNPTSFELFHKSTRQPFDHYQLGLDFVDKVLIRSESTIINEPLLQTIEAQIANGENVIFFSNHQTEIDPQIIQLLIQNKHPNLAQNMIFVAGHRVTTDPFAIPISLGCSLLCIYSKKHMGQNAEQAKQRLSHNRKTIRKLSELLSQGGQCIYVAPSGGRDRPNGDKVEIDPFDPQSIDLFYLLARSQKNIKTHFYPLALYTFPLLPPPNKVRSTLGEPRVTKASRAGMGIGNEIDRSSIPKDKESRIEWIKSHTESIQKNVGNLYSQLENDQA